MTKIFYAGRLILFAAITAASVMAGCEKIEERDPCLQPRAVSLRGGAYRRAADTGLAITDTTLRFIFLKPIGGQTGFAFSSSKKFSVFLSPQADSCQYVLATDTAQASALLDTLTFRYTRRTQFLSNACGYTYFFTLDTVLATVNRLDSVRITNREVTNDANVEHLRLFYAR